MENEEKKYRRIGGWLHVLQIGLLLNAFSWLRNVQLFLGLKEEYGNKIGEAARMSFIWFELVASFVMLGFSVIVIFYFFKTRRVVILLLPIYLSFELLEELLVYFLFGHLTGNMEMVLYKVIFSIAVIGLTAVYWFKSERVKRTFVL